MVIKHSSRVGQRHAGGAGRFGVHVNADAGGGGAHIARFVIPSAQVEDGFSFHIVFGREGGCIGFLVAASSPCAHDALLTEHRRQKRRCFAENQGQCGCLAKLQSGFIAAQADRGRGVVNLPVRG